MISFFERRKVFSWIIVIFIAVFIFYVSSMNFENYSTSNSLKAEIYHISIFFLFSFFLMVALSGGKKVKLVFLAIILAFAYGVSDELHQFFVPGRDASVFDVFLDSLGVVFASLVYGISLRFRKLRSK